MTGLEIAMIISAIGGGIGGAFGGSKGGTKETAVGYGDPSRGRQLGIDPITTLAKALGNVETLGGVLTERAQQPITLPGAFAQPPPTIWGRGMPMPIGLTGLDPALLNPNLLASQGVQFPEPQLQINESGGWDPVDYYGPPPFSGGAKGPPQPREWMFPGAPRLQQSFERDSTGALIARQPGYFEGGYGGLDQPLPTMPQLGGGLPGLADALQMLGVVEDPFGRWGVGAANPFYVPNPPGPEPPDLPDVPPKPGPKGPENGNGNGNGNGGPVLWPSGG